MARTSVIKIVSDRLEHRRVKKGYKGKQGEGVGPAFAILALSEIEWI